MRAMTFRLGDHIALTAAENPTPARAGFFSLTRIGVLSIQNDRS
jgi:hypothetical protein